MAALALAFLAFVKPGGRIVASDCLYGRTYKLLASLKTHGISSVVVDTMDLKAVSAALNAPSDLLLVETIANPLLGVADLVGLANAAHIAGAKLFVDNTFAGPTVCRPLDLGADLVMESVPKMIGGHSDVTLGYLGGRDASNQATISDMAGTWGFFASPFDCWLALRGLTTLDLRMSAAAANARRLAAWLATQPSVLRVIDPCLANMLAFELPDRAAVNAFMKAAPGLPFCPSLGHHETTLSYPWSTSHRAVSDAEKLRLGITPGLVRVSVGCEPYDQLQNKFMPVSDASQKRPSR